MKRVFIKDEQSRVTRYTCNFIDISFSEIGVQATAPAKKVGNNIIIADCWETIPTKDGQKLNGKYKVFSEHKKGNLTIIIADKID